MRLLSLRGLLKWLLTPITEMWWPGHYCCDIREMDSGHWPPSWATGHMTPGVFQCDAGHRRGRRMTSERSHNNWLLRLQRETWNREAARVTHTPESGWSWELRALQSIPLAVLWNILKIPRTQWADLQVEYHRYLVWWEISSERLYLSDSCHWGWSILTYHRYPRLMMTRAALPPPPRPRPIQTPRDRSWSAEDWWWCSLWLSWCCSVSWSRWVSSTASCITPLSTGISPSPSWSPASPELQAGDENMRRMKTK